MWYGRAFWKPVFIHCTTLIKGESWKKFKMLGIRLMKPNGKVTNP